MKKIILSVCFLFGVITFVSAQGKGGGNSPKRMAQMKQRLKDEVKLTDVQIDSVMAINQAYQPRTKEIKMDQNMSDADKHAKMKTINDERAKRIESAIGKDAAQKVTDFNAKMRANDGGGNRPQGQGNN